MSALYYEPIDVTVCVLLVSCPDPLLVRNSNFFYGRDKTSVLHALSTNGPHTSESLEVCSVEVKTGVFCGQKKRLEDCWRVKNMTCMSSGGGGGGGEEGEQD